MIGKSLKLAITVALLTNQVTAIGPKAAIQKKQSIKDGDMVTEYWPEIDEKTGEIKLVCKMIWQNFEEPTTYKNEMGENKTIKNDSIRICFNFRPHGTKYYEQCNFFIRKWEG